MNKAIFLDRDGTINVEKDYLYKIDEFEFLPRVPEALRLLQAAGFLLIIVTNQSGMARGYYSEEDFLKLNKWMISTLEAEGIHISRVYYCPHHPEGTIEKYRIDCNCRKPRLGMYEQAATDFDISFSESYAIGDKMRDCAICNVSDCRGYLVGNNESYSVINQVKYGSNTRIKYSKDLFSAVYDIVNGKNDICNEE